MTMSKQSSLTTILIDEKSLGALEKIVLALLGSVLLIVSAKISIPFWPVPSTMQSLAVVMLGIFLGPRLAFGATITYLFEGMLGIPVFANSLAYPGFAFLTLASGGFLLSFPIAAYIAGSLAERGWMNGRLSSMALFGVCTLIIYGIGMPWLVTFVGIELAWQNFLAWMPANLAKVGLGYSIVQLYARIKSHKTS